MSLLEDVFLEDEAGEAQDLERIIEGDDFDERPRSPDSDQNSAKEDEAEEEKQRVDPAKPKRVLQNPRFVLNPARLTGPRGIQVLPDHFKDFKFRGKGHEKSDLDLVLKKLEHWAYRLYPKFQFEDCLKKIETLGKKRAVSVHLTKLRMDMITSEETVVQRDSSDDEAPALAPEEDEFDRLLQQQIEIARATPAPASGKKTPFTDRASLMPKATSSPSINEEQRERMLRNRRMAEERRLAKLNQNASQENVENGEATSNIDGKVDNNFESGDKGYVNDLFESEKANGNKRQSNKDDIVELDDGLVSNSYEPAKKHNRSDVNVKDVTNDVDAAGNGVVEIDENGQVTKSYVPAKKHNRSRIDSSDDDDNIDEPVIVDVEKHHIDASRSTHSRPMRNSSEDEHESETKTTGVNSLSSSGRKHKSNVIDSSDDDEPLVMNESITIDVHTSGKDDTNSNIISDSNIKGKASENDSVFDSLITTESKNIEEISDDNKTDAGNDIRDVRNNSNSEINKSIYTIENTDSKENTDDGSENVEDLMDVDFNNDF